MNNEEKKKYIVDAYVTRIGLLKGQWAQNHIAITVNTIIAATSTNTEKQINEAKLEIEKATLQLKIAEQSIILFEDLLAKEQ